MEAIPLSVAFFTIRKNSFLQRSILSLKGGEGRERNVDEAEEEEEEEDEEGGGCVGRGRRS